MPGELAIFPLETVLFPDGVLTLRVFEARYLDLVSECTAAGSPFGVCLITEGSEIDPGATHEPVGCTARIIDFDVEDSGLLNVRALGGQRFRVLDRRLRQDGLIRADIEMIDPDDEVPVPEEHADCETLVRRLVDDLVARESDPMRRMIAEPYRFDSASWVGNRICEFLPIAPRARQKLMELNDAAMRLSLIHQYLHQHQVL
ncbi:MAG TPA: LON peptidase substrate-binding domain-containing protein [Zeimonas sp.]